MPKNDYLIPFILPIVVFLIIGAVVYAIRDFNKMNKKDKDKFNLP